MHWIIAKKEFLSNLLNFRFIAGFILCFLLTVLSAWIVTEDYAFLIADYSERKEKHKEELENAKVYSEIKVTLDFRPEPLSVFCEGVSKQLSNSVSVSHGKVPKISANKGASNPLLAGFPSLDLSLIVQVVFSLLALLFVYDAISGEKESGTLSLVLANQVPRHQVIIGKYLGIFLSIGVPIFASILALLAYVILSPAIALSSSDWTRLVLIAFSSLLYISVFINCGFFVSSVTSRSTISAMFLLFFWVTFVLFIPRGSLFFASYFRPVSSLDVIEERTKKLWDEFDAKVEEFNDAHPAKGTSVFDFGHKVFLGERRKMMAEREQTKFREPLRIEYANKVWRIRQKFYTELKTSASLAKNLARISPQMAYQNAASALAKTNTQSYFSFIKQARNYRTLLIDYLQSKEAFSSFLFFTRQKKEEMFNGEEFQKWLQRKYWNKWKRKLEAGKKMSEVNPWNNVKPLDLSDMPAFKFNEPTVSESINSAFFDVLILFLLNVLFFLMAYLSFLKTDVRR